ncbi:MAG: adenylate kinase family protein [Halanaerobiaceae bacterium]
MNMVIMGLPGAGKGTHAQRLEDEFEMVHISSGDIIKSEIDKGTTLGKKAKEYVACGDLVPDDIIIKMIKDTLKNKSREDFLFDGFPRTIRQAKELDKICASQKNEIDLSIYLHVADQNLLKRISGRRICPEGTVYNVEFNPPEEKGVCDKCGGRLYQREDDQEEIVKKRISESKARIIKIVDFYQQKGILETIEGTDRTPDQVHEDVRNVVKEYLACS